MIIGNASLTVEDVEMHASSYEELTKYSDSQIPEEWRHLQVIVDNQRYICAMLLRKSTKIEWKEKRELIDRILSEVKIVGYTDVLYDAKTIWSLISRERVLEYYERSLSGNVKPKRGSRKLS